MNIRNIKILALGLIISLTAASCKKDVPRKKPEPNACKMTGTVAHLPLFCGTPPVVYETGIKDLAGNFYRIQRDMTGDFASLSLGDTITFTMGPLSRKDPMIVSNGDLLCVGKLASAPNSLKGNMVMLQVDHETYAFEGGHEQQFFRADPNIDSIPLMMHYTPPGDFGGVGIYYSPTGETVFAGSIIWMGLGKMEHPKSLKPADQYHLSRTPAQMPDSADIQFLHHVREPNHGNIDYKQIWNSIKHLQITRQYMEKGATVAIYKYTPSVGIGDPKDWNYMVFLHYKQNQ